MNTTESVFYAIGVFSSIFFGMTGLAWFFELAIGWILSSVWTQKEFLAFVWNRLKAKPQEGAVPHE